LDSVEAMAGLIFPSGDETIFIRGYAGIGFEPEGEFGFHGAEIVIALHGNNEREQ
jgi:hypothetical protein